MEAKTITKVIAISLVTSSFLYATNGDNLIGIGTKARGMGGVGVGLSHGAESGLANPALITEVDGTEISFGGTLFMPEIKSKLNGAAGAPVPPQGNYTSDADMSMIPEVSIAHRLDNNWYIGVGMWGTAGMGTDYSKADFNPLATGQFGNFKMVTNLQLMQFGVPIAYRIEGFSIAVTPILQYGNLDINYQMPTPAGTIANVGAGLAQDFGFGYNVGFSYDLTTNGMTGFTLGATYKSAVEMNYDGQLTTATGPFQLALPNGDTLEQPEEFGAGLSYVINQHTFAFDYRHIKWSDTKGYGDFGWKNSDVIAVGYQFAQDNWAMRFGYNYADTAVVEGKDPRLNFFNLLGFPATAETHYTMGGSYLFSGNISLDLAYVYQPAVKKTFSTAGLGLPFSSLTTEHREDSLSFQLNYKF